MSRSQAAKGIYPTVAPLQLSNKMMDRFFWGDRHYTFAENVREHLAHFQELEDIIALLGLEALSEKKRVLLYACARCSVISHNLSCDDLTTGIQGVLIKLDQTLADCEPFLHGDFDTVPEKHCDIRGSMQEDTLLRVPKHF